MRSLTALFIACLVVVLPGLSHAKPLDLGHTAVLPAIDAGTVVDAVPGDAPSPQRPRGTIVVAASVQACGPALVEWDLARDRAIRQTCLGLTTSNMRLARAGTKLQVLAVGRTRVLAQVDVTSLRVERRLELGVGSYSGLATDGALTVVASNPRYDQRGDAWLLTTVDRDGRIRGSATLRGTLGHGPDVEIAVAAGRAFVITMADPPADPKPRLIAIDADGTMAGQLALDAQVEHPWLAVRGDRLVVSLGREMLELSPDLKPLARHPASAEGRIAVSADGHVLTGDGSILAPTFAAERSIVTDEPWVHAVLWLGSTPVVVGSFAEVVRYARIHWWDPV